MLARFLINGEYAKLWLAELVSLLGDAIFDTTLLLWVGTRVAHGYSWAPLAASGVLIAVALPGMVFGPVAGVFVDRWNLQRTMLVADALRALLVALLFGMALLPAGTLGAPAQLVAIYLVVALASVCSQFFNPARFAFIGDLVTPEERPRASSIGQATSSAAAVIGPPLAAPLLITVGVQWALLFNALSFVASFAAVRAIRAPAIERAPAAAGPGFGPQFLDGVRFYVTHRVLMAVLATAGLVTVGAAVLNALDVFFITDNLHTSATWLGTLSTALGLGSIAGALLPGWVTGRLGLARTYSVGLFLAGVAMVAYSRSTSIGVALAFVFLAGLPIAAVNSVVGPILLKVTPTGVPRPHVLRGQPGPPGGRHGEHRRLRVAGQHPAARLRRAGTRPAPGYLRHPVRRGRGTGRGGRSLGPGHPARSAARRIRRRPVHRPDAGRRIGARLTIRR